MRAKTTFAEEFLPHEAGCPEFVNADLIAAGLSPFRPEHVAIVVNIKGDSYRMKEKRLTGLFPGSVALPNATPKRGPRTKSK